ncbi:hypothetical protein RIVM261_067710 [Rivularia sp. IAM M-261]|nr:hypothetical protein RIVM261_067710 [Rivularia sp. IAM M-261]
MLERAGLVAQSREAQWRPCRLEIEPLKDAANWIEQYRQFWEENLDCLDDYLRDFQKINSSCCGAGILARLRLEQASLPAPQKNFGDFFICSKSWTI